MASSSSNPHVCMEIGEENPFPYPSHVYTPSFVTLKLSGREKYGIWKTQMLCLLKSHGMFGFIDGTIVSPSSSSVSGKEIVDDHHTQWLWTRSDALVKGWILGSLSEQTLTCVFNRLTEKQHQDKSRADYNAKDVWDELQTMYAPALLGIKDKQEKDIPEHHQMFYMSILRGDFNHIKLLLSKGEATVVDKITNNGNTGLHVAVGTTKNPEFLQNMLQLTPENTQLLGVRNSDGNTLLHVAAIIGNSEAANILVERNRDLLFAKNNEGHTPLAITLSHMHTETAHNLLQHLKTDIEKDAMFSGASGDALIVSAISSKDFGLAINLLRRYRTLHSDTVLVAIAQNYPPELNVFERYIGTNIICDRINHVRKTCLDYTDRCLPSRGSWMEIIIVLFFLGICGIFWLLLLIPKILDTHLGLRCSIPFHKERVRAHENAIKLLDITCSLIRDKKESNSYRHYYTNPILEATRQNAYKVVQRIMYRFPNAFWSTNEDGHNIIQYAVINRSEEVYNLLYQMSEHKNTYRTIKDSSSNNLLQLAARLAPTNKLNLISGAALQIQRELQWFKEVERFVCPLSITQKNSFGEIPKMVFTREHKDLVILGEKWMKATAESYTITAALIITVEFAAAITAPGGSNQETGLPIFTNNTAFTIFAISDAISLFAAVTSLLMFLSILTARFAEQDFLIKLPTRLIIGLATLFISTTAMIVAFGATLYLVFGQSNSRILIPIAVLTCLPITSFVTLQFPLVIELMSATYGRSIFGKKRDDTLY